MEKIKTFFITVWGVIVVLNLLFMTIMMLIMIGFEKIFMSVCNLIAILNLLWLVIATSFVALSFFIGLNGEISSGSDLERVSRSFFNFYLHPHGVLMVGVVIIITIITLWRGLHFILSSKFFKENFQDKVLGGVF